MTLITQKDDPTKKPDPKPKNAAEAKVAEARAAARARRVAEEEAEAASAFSMMNIRGNFMQSKAVKAVLWLLIFIFAVGGFIFSALPGNDSQTGNPMAASGPDPVAQSGEVAVSRDEFNRSYEQQVRMATMYGQSPDATNMLNHAQPGVAKPAGKRLHGAGCQRRGHHGFERRR
jgi:hypothetical protein